MISPRDIPAEQGAQYSQDVNRGGNPEGPRRGRRDIAALSWKNKFQSELFSFFCYNNFFFFFQRNLIFQQFRS